MSKLVQERRMHAMKNTILSFALPLLLALSPASASADRLLWVGVDGAATIGDTTVSQYQVAGNSIDSFRITVPDEESLVFAYDGNDGALVVDDTTALNFGAGVAEWATLNLADYADPDLVVTMELGNNSGSAFKPMATATETLGTLTNAPHVSLQADLNPPAMTPWTPANFTAVGVWTISYYLDGGTNDDANPTNYNVFTDLPITLNDATRDGYTFAGWTNELGEVVTAVAADSTGDRFFGATWLENVEVPTLADKSYNGELQTADVPENAGYTVTANAGGTDVDDYAVTLSLNSGYAWADGSTNDQTVTWAITPIEVTVEIVGASATATFDGTAHTVRGYTATASTPLYNVDHDIAFSGTAEATRTVVGKTDMGLTAAQFSNTNPNFSTVTFTVTDGYQTITPKAITVTVTGTASSSTYTGSEQTGTVAYTLASNDSLFNAANVSFSGTATVTGTAVGNYNYGLAAGQFSYNDGNINATFDVTDAAFSITKASITVTVTGTASSATYTGSEQTGTVAYTLASEDALFDASKVSYSGVAAVTGTTVASYEYGLDASDFSYDDANIDATFDVTDAAFTITKASITITVTGTASSETYTGAEQTEPVAYTLASEDALYDASKVAYSGAATVAGTTVGSYAYGLDDSDFSYADDNIAATFTVTDAAFAITPASITITVTGTASSATYTGSEQTGTVAYTLASEDALYDASKVNYSGASTVAGTTVGDYAYGLDEGNFTYDDADVEVAFTVTDANFSITPAAATVTADDLSKVAGNADPTLTATVTGLFGSDTVSYTLARVAGEAVGTYAITPSGDVEQGNYTVSYVPGTFTISGAVAARISADGTSTSYYATLVAAVGAAQDGETVQLLSDVTLDARVEPNVGAGTSLAIDLGGFTVTREGTDGNGSAFDVKSGSVVITNGVIDCTQDDTAIAADGVYAITVRGGAAVTLADLDVTVDSECGACAYPFAGASLTIESGTYANTTTVP